MTDQRAAATAGPGGGGHARTNVRWSRRRLLVATALVSVAALALGGWVVLSGRSRGTGPTTYLKLGQTATLRDDTGNAVEMTIADATLRTGCDGPVMNIVNQRNVYVTVTVAVVTGSWSVDAANFGLTSQPWPAGSLHVGSSGEECGTDLAAGTISAGETRHGHLALLIHDTLPNQIAYGGGMGVPPASWTWR